MSDMEELKKEIESIKDMCKPLENAIKAEFAKGIENVNTHEIGEAVDMLKDFAQAIESKSQATYYCSIIKAMEDAKDDDELREKIMEITDPSDLRGYNSNRYANGRYAPSGYGNRTYVAPEGYYMPSMSTPSMNNDRMMYYDSNGSGMSNSSGMSSNGNGSSGMQTYSTPNMTSGADRMQRAESRYDMARRGYSDSKYMNSGNTTQDKEARMKKAEDYVHSITDDVMDLIKDAPADEKTMLKQKFQTMISKMN